MSVVYPSVEPGITPIVCAEIIVCSPVIGKFVLGLISDGTRTDAIVMGKTA